MATTCGACHGQGWVKCPRCEGKGEIDGGLFVGRYQCTNCGGSGVKTCGACNGKGYVVNSG